MTTTGQLCEKNAGRLEYKCFIIQKITSFGFGFVIVRAASPIPAFWVLLLIPSDRK
jgi:hypothetical protein